MKVLKHTNMTPKMLECIDEMKDYYGLASFSEVIRLSVAKAYNDFKRLQKNNNQTPILNSRL